MPACEALKISARGIWPLSSALSFSPGLSDAPVGYAGGC
jgi:hypothetical protein